MATVDNALTTLSRLKSYLEVSGSSKDTLLTMILIGASNFVETYCRRKFGYATYANEEYFGTGRNKLPLRNYPVISVSQVEVMNNALNNESWRLLDPTWYQIDNKPGIIHAITFCFAESRGKKNYRVSYVAGYTLPSDTAHYQDGTDDDLDLPYDLEMAVLKLCSYEYRKRKSVGVSSERVRDMGITYMKATEQDDEVKRILNLYKRPVYA